MRSTSMGQYKSGWGRFFAVLLLGYPHPSPLPYVKWLICNDLPKMAPLKFSKQMGYGQIFVNK
jgi:hypothetical protein